MSGHQAVYAGDGRLLVTTAWGFHLYCPSREMSIVPQLVSRGVFEPELADYLRAHVSAGDTTIDVGANIGVFTTLLGHLVGERGQVFAFEPVSANFTFLQDNVESNWLGRRVSLHRCALGDHTGTVFIKSHEQWGGLASALSLDSAQMTVGVSDAGSYIEQVETLRLDDILEGEGQVALIKIDVEGYELRVFRGMQALLEGGRVRSVVFECIADRMGDDWQPFVELLQLHEGSGWTFGVIGQAGSVTPVSVADIAQHGYLYHVLMTDPSVTETSPEPSRPALVVGPDDPARAGDGKA